VLTLLIMAFAMLFTRRRATILEYQRRAGTAEC